MSDTAEHEKESVTQDSVATDWLERLERAMHEIRHKSRMPMTLAIELQYAYDHLRAAEKCAKERQGRSNARTEAPRE